MADLTQEQYEQLPEFIRGDYAQDGEVFKPVGELKALKLKNSLNELDNKYKETSGKLSEYEKRQADNAAEAERKALEKLRADGKVDELLADQERRHGETAKQYQDRIDALTSKAKASAKSSIVSELSTFATDSGKAAYKRLIDSMVDYDPITGEEIYYNVDGSASSVKTRQEFFDEVIAKSDIFQPLIKAAPTTEGIGNARGNGGNSGSTTDANAKAEAARKKGDLRGYLNAALNPN
jgi:hypothetical protein